MRQVLQCSSPADGVEGRDWELLLWRLAQGHLPAAEAMAAGGQGEGDGGVGRCAGGDDGVPEGVRVGGAGVSREGGRLEHGLRAHVYECVLSRAERVGSRGEEKRDDLTSACGDIHAGSNNAVA